MDPKLKNMFSKSNFTISSKPYYYCKIQHYPSNPQKHFFISKDTDEITVVTQHPKELELLIEKDPNEWLLVSLNLATPFMKGTLFNVSKAIYEEDANILIVSTYSKDLLFIKKQDKEKVIKALRKLGFKFTQ